MIMVTGAAGFIGSAIVAMLNAKGINEILCVDKLETREKWKNLLNKRFLDIIDYDQLFIYMDTYKKRAVAMRDQDIVIHMGACTSTTEQDMDFLIDKNYRFSQELYRLCINKNLRFLYASSASTYGDGAHGFSDHNMDLAPLNKYGYSKHLFDIWQLNQLEKPMQCVGLKLFNVYGPNEYHKDQMGSVIYKFYIQAESNGYIDIYGTNGMQSRDFVYIKDVTSVVWHFIQHPEYNGIFNVGSGQQTDFNTIARLIFTYSRKPIQIRYVQMPADLKDVYQWHTLANLSKLQKTGTPRSSIQ